MKQLHQRILVGSILLLVCVGLLYLDFLLGVFYCYYALAACLVAVALYEFYGLTEARGIFPHKYLGVFCGTILAVSSKELWARLFGLDIQTARAVATGVSLFAISAVIIGVFVQQILKRCRNDAFIDIAATLFGLSYIAFLGSFFVKIRHLYDGTGPKFELSNYLFVLLFVLGCKGGDIAAYLVGRKFGRHRLIPEISPNKSIEGAIAALVCGSLAGFTFGLAFGSWLHFRWYYGIIFGFVLASAGLVGDLAESLTKRKLEVKDSANLIPTFGGVLDVVDALLFAAPAVYYLWVILDAVGGFAA